MNSEPYEVLESSFSRMQQRKAVVQAKVRNMTSGKIFDISPQASDQYEEADVQRKTVLFLYQHRGEYVFTDPADKKNRFSLTEDAVSDNKKWLKPNTEITALFFNNKLINFKMPIKMDFEVTEAPPGVQGDRSQSGTKAVTLETGTIIQAPLFINTGDVVRVNTEAGIYVERMEKA